MLPPPASSAADLPPPPLEVLLPYSPPWLDAMSCRGRLRSGGHHSPAPSLRGLSGSQTLGMHDGMIGGSLGGLLEGIRPRAAKAG